MREQNLPILESYAAALELAARTRGQLDAVLEEALGLHQILQSNRALLRLLEKPAILKEEKTALVRRVFQDRLSPLMLHLGLLLVDKHRGGLWDGVLDAFIRLVETGKGIHSAQVTTAFPLSAEEQESLHRSLEAFTGKHLRVAYRENPALLGGVLFRAGDLMIDDSLSGHLKALRAQLLAVRVEAS